MTIGDVARYVSTLITYKIKNNNMTDLPGKAIYDRHFNKSRKKLFVHDTFGPKVEMPVSYYFRTYNQMPELEKKALQLCEGKILDIGAAAGSHSLELQKNGKDYIALEISPSACEVMKDRRVKNILTADFFQYNKEKFDTLLLLMNGIGLCGSLQGFRKFLSHAKTLLNENGKIIFDSCDISYMYEDGEEMPTDRYYGEVTCMYEYDKALTEPFEWLYLDPDTLKQIAKEENWQVDIVMEDENDQYLAVVRHKD